MVLTSNQINKKILKKSTELLLIREIFPKKPSLLIIENREKVKEYAQKWLLLTPNEDRGSINKEFHWIKADDANIIYCVDRSKITKRQLKWAGLGKQIKIASPLYIGPCVVCKTRFISKSVKQRYCSPECKKRAFVARRKKAIKPAISKICPRCNMEFTAQHTDAKYCNKSWCRKREYRKKKVISPELQ